MDLLKFEVGGDVPVALRIEDPDGFSLSALLQQSLDGFHGIGAVVVRLGPPASLLEFQVEEDALDPVVEVDAQQDSGDMSILGDEDGLAF